MKYEKAREGAKEDMKELIEDRLKSKAQKIKENPIDDDLTDLRDLCQLNLLKEKL